MHTRRSRLGQASQALRWGRYLLSQLSAFTPTDAYTFFAGMTDLLDELTPVEVLTGKLVEARPLEGGRA